MPPLSAGQLGCPRWARCPRRAGRPRGPWRAHTRPRVVLAAGAIISPLPPLAGPFLFPVGPLESPVGLLEFPVGPLEFPVGLLLRTVGFLVGPL
jgi:hypothetical protein